MNVWVSSLYDLTVLYIARYSEWVSSVHAPSTQTQLEDGAPGICLPTTL